MPAQDGAAWVGGLARDGRQRADTVHAGEGTRTVERSAARAAAGRGADLLNPGCARGQRERRDRCKKLVAALSWELGWGAVAEGHREMLLADESWRNSRQADSYFARPGIPE